MVNYTALYGSGNKFVGVRRDDGAQIPPDPNNKDWKEFLTWNETAPSPVSTTDNPPPTPAEQASAIRDWATTLTANKDGVSQLIRAELLVTMDEVNVLRQWIADFKVAVFNAGTLAALKTAVAALPAMPQRTSGQIKPALISRISTSEAD